MSRPVPAPILLLAVLGLAAVTSRAQSGPAPSGPGGTPAIRPLPAEAAAALAATIPKYDPTAAATAAAARNKEIILPLVLLPNFSVTDRRIPYFPERSMFTRKELERIAIQRYLSPLDYGFLNRIVLFKDGYSPAERAMRAYDRDEAKRNASEMAGLEQLESIQDPAPAK